MKLVSRIISSRSRRALRLGQAGVVALAAATLATSSLFAQAPAASAVSTGPVVQLPPMLVEDSAKSEPWLYAAAGDTEFLSRASQGVTREYIEARLTIHALLRTIIPDDFLAKYAAPGVTILVRPSEVPTNNDAVMQNMMRADDELRQKKIEKANSQGRLVVDRYQFMPNMRLDDRDMMGSFAIIDGAAFDGARLVLTADFVHSMLTRRTPMLPQWVVEGIRGVYEEVDSRASPMVIRPMTWISREETLALQRDPEARRVLLPVTELFAPDALIGDGRTHPVRSTAWRAQAALFVRWAFDPANRGMREALWRLAERACREPMTEALFTECFGFGYVDLLDRLSDYLPTAVKERILLPEVKLPPLPRIEIKRATPAQVGRLRGEWERLEISAVRETHPHFAASYAEQARKSFRRALESGEARDPATVAAAGLCEIDAGNPAAARPLLEEAVTARVIRPRAYFELAKIRWLELTKDAPRGQRFSAAQCRPILDPLREALAQAPLLPEVLLLIMDVWLRCEEPISSLELETLTALAPRLRRYSFVGLDLALLHSTLGKNAEAGTVLNASFPFVTEPAVRARYQQAYALLTRPPEKKK